LTNFDKGNHKMNYITLHESQINNIAAQLDTGDELAVRVQANQVRRDEALRVLEAAGLTVPEAGAFTLQQLDAALDAVIPFSSHNAITRRMEIKAKAYDGGLVLEKSNVDKRALTICGLMARKGGFPLPDGRPYSVVELDAVLAAADPPISIEHRLEIKSAFSKAGLVENGVVEKTQVQPIQAAKSICDTLGFAFPTNGMKLSTGVVDSAMAERHWDERRRLSTKITLQSAGAL
jgi:hypothetical protein